MFSERWICFCCPPMHKPPRRSIVSPMEQNDIQPKAVSQLQLFPPINRPKKKSDLSMYKKFCLKISMFIFNSFSCGCYYSNMV